MAALYCRVSNERGASKAQIASTNLTVELFHGSKEVSTPCGVLRVVREPATGDITIEFNQQLLKTISPK